MKTVRLSRFGGPEVLELVDVPAAQPAAGQVLVRVHAAGINFADTLIRQNRYAVTPQLPAVLGTEAAGIVEAVGDGVKELTVGDRVAAALFASDAPFGGYADQVLVDAGYVVPLPQALPFEQAAALMVQGLTALHLVRQAPPRNKTVLVNAAAGGVGSLLVQLARRAGAARVLAAAGSAAKLDFARSLGADAVVDYTRAGWVERTLAAADGRGPDIIYESVGGAIIRDCLSLLAPLGQLVIYGALNIQQFELGVPELLGLIFKNQSLTGFAFAPLLTRESLKADLGELFDLAERGQVKVTVGGTYPLAKAGEAHAALESRSSSGKLVLIP